MRFAAALRPHSLSSPPFLRLFPSVHATAVRLFGSDQWHARHRLTCGRRPQPGGAWNCAMSVAFPRSLPKVGTGETALSGPKHGAGDGPGKHQRRRTLRSRIIGSPITIASTSTCGGSHTLAPRHGKVARQARSSHPSPPQGSCITPLTCSTALAKHMTRFSAGRIGGTGGCNTRCGTSSSVCL